MDLTKEEISSLEDLQNNRGWKVYKLLLQGLLTIEYNRLRSVLPEELTYQQGLLDGIERCLTYVDSELDDIKINKDVSDKADAPERSYND